MSWWQQPLAHAWVEVESGANLAELVFAKLGYAWLGLLVPLAVAAYLWAARQRRAAVERLGNPILLARLLATVDPGKRLIRALLTVLALAAVVLGMMRLQYGGKAKVLPTRGLDIVLAVDYSKSMLAQDVYPSRSERLEAELTRFLDESGRRGDRVGVVVFAGATRAFPLTSDMGVLSLFLSHADPRFENPGGTAIGKALDKSIELLVAVRRDGGNDESEIDAGLLPGADDDDAAVAERADQIIILLTDGEDTLGRPLELAQKAAQLGIRIYPVGIGSTSGEPIMRYDENGEPTGYATDAEGKPQMTRLDAETLQSLAKATKGEYVHVDADQFGLDEVRGLVEGLAAAQREHSIEIHREEGFLFFLIPAVLLLCGALAIGDRRRPPAAQGRDAHLVGASAKPTNPKLQEPQS
ncbi:vWA domain-containing protein [Enhygromyxa salina]|uniref:von Willebrand factor type A domain protein n=1 Tax=Enhygromyxa salina TaxID=215803 RepID=A0A2S9XTV2_9BACT|nr:VWA domain-containing protein [Enhygromyxa salina]PRP96296.1 von Willebrand factor type A domain protein [Enhygromyxa salina]